VDTTLNIVSCNEAHHHHPANHGVSSDFQRFLDSAAIELDVSLFNDLIFDLSLLRCSSFMGHAVLL